MMHTSGWSYGHRCKQRDAAELRGYWDELSTDGTVSVPLEKQMWGDESGMCVDRFGIAWMLNIAQPQG
jgi:PhnB protein